MTNVRHGNSENTAHILLIPFTIEPTSELTLSRRITNTLISVLMTQKNIKIIHSNMEYSSSNLFTQETQSRMSHLAKEKNCDYVIYGNVNIFEKRVSLGTFLLNVPKQKILNSSYDVLNTIDDIPNWLNNWVEKAIGCVKSQQNLTYQEPPKIMSVDNEIIGMDTADIDNDRQNEIFLYSPKKVLIFDRNFSKISTYNSRYGKTIIHAKWITAIKDLPDCLIISETSGADVISTFYQIKNKQFIELKSYKGWFISTVPTKNNKNRIIAQKREYTDYRDEIMTLSGPFNQLSFHPFPLSTGSDIFHFTFLNQHTSTDPLLIKYETNDRLAVYDNQTLLWKSSESFGGSLHYIDVQKETGSIESSIRKFFPSQLLTLDIDNDQCHELIVCQNHSSARRLFEKSRWFSDGVVHILKWNGNTLKNVWTSEKQPGPVTAYAIDNINGTWQIWIVCVLKQKRLFHSGQSRIVLYNLGLLEK